MGRHLCEDLAKSEGFCCLWSCLMLNTNVKSGAFAKRYGVTRQAIVYHRAKLRRGTLTCPGNKKNCMAQLIKEARS